MKLEYQWTRLESLNALEFHEIIKARESVFVVEQKCAYQEADDMDPQSWHLAVRIEGELAAYIRLVDPGVKYEQPSIGRVLTLKKYRNMKIGRSIMKEAIRFAGQTFPNMDIQIGAQVYAQGFYESLGFTPLSESYDEDGIPHIDMLRQADLV